MGISLGASLGIGLGLGLIQGRDLRVCLGLGLGLIQGPGLGLGLGLSLGLGLGLYLSLGLGLGRRVNKREINMFYDDNESKDYDGLDESFDEYNEVGIGGVIAVSFTLIAACTFIYACYPGVSI